MRSRPTIWPTACGAGLWKPPASLVDEVVVVPSGTIPKTTSGKLQRVRVRQRFEAGTLVRPRQSMSRVKLAGHLVRTQLVYAKARVRRAFKGRGATEE